MPRDNGAEVMAAYRPLFDSAWPRIDERAAYLADMPWTTPEETRRHIERQFIARHVDWDPRRSRHAKSIGAQFLAEGLRDVAAIVWALRQNLPNVPRRALRELRVRNPKPRAHAWARPLAYARNLELAWFVAERVITIQQLHDHVLRPGHRGPVGTPWEYLRSEWNRLHPHPRDRLHSGRTLSREYYRAVGDDYLVHALLGEFADSISRHIRHIRLGSQAAAAAVLETPRAALPQRAAAAMDTPSVQAAFASVEAARQQLLALRKSASPECWRSVLTSLLRQRRDLRTRDDLIREYVLFFFIAVGLGGTDADNVAEYTRRRSLPLRYWFPDEARGAENAEEALFSHLLRQSPRNWRQS